MGPFCKFTLVKREKELWAREKGRKDAQNDIHLSYVHFPSLFLSLQICDGGIDAQGIGQRLGSLGGDAVAVEAEEKNVFEHCEEGNNMSKVHEGSKTKVR